MNTQKSARSGLHPAPLPEPETSSRASVAAYVAHSKASHEGSANRAAYRTVKAQLDFRRNTWVSIAMVTVDLTLLATALWFVSSGSTALFLIAQPILAVFFFRSFCLLHESGHGNCSPHRWVNALLGFYASIGCCIPFLPWKDLHQKHHVWAGNAEHDPTMRNLKVWRERGRIPWIVRFGWRTWIPLGAFAQHLVFLAYPFRLVREERDKLARASFSTLLIPTAYAMLHVLAPTLFHAANFLIGILLFLIAEELVNLPHHSDLCVWNERLPLWDQARATRSCYYPVGISEFFVLNFNFHTEHHLFPSLPWYRLRAARPLVRDALGDSYHEAIGIAWNLERRGATIDRVVFGEARA